MNIPRSVLRFYPQPSQAGSQKWGMELNPTPDGEFLGVGVQKCWQQLNKTALRFQKQQQQQSCQQMSFNHQTKLPHLLEEEEWGKTVCLYDRSVPSPHKLPPLFNALLIQYDLRFATVCRHTKSICAVVPPTGNKYPSHSKPSLMIPDHTLFTNNPTSVVLTIQA